MFMVKARDEACIEWVSDVRNKSASPAKPVKLTGKNIRNAKDVSTPKTKDRG